MVYKRLHKREKKGEKENVSFFFNSFFPSLPSYSPLFSLFFFSLARSMISAAKSQLKISLSRAFCPNPAYLFTLLEIFFQNNNHDDMMM